MKTLIKQLFMKKDSDLNRLEKELQKHQTVTEYDVQLIP